MKESQIQRSTIGKGNRSEKGFKRNQQE